MDIEDFTTLSVNFPCCCLLGHSLPPHGLHCPQRPGFPVLHYLPEFAQSHVLRVDGAIQPSHPLLPPSPALDLSQHQGLFSNELVLCIRYQSIGASASASVLPMSILAVQGTLKSLLQHHSLKASILWRSAFMVHLTHLYMTTRKTIALIYRPLLSK